MRTMCSLDVNNLAVKYVIIPLEHSRAGHPQSEGAFSQTVWPTHSLLAALWLEVGTTSLGAEAVRLQAGVRTCPQEPISWVLAYSSNTAHPTKTGQLLGLAHLSRSVHAHYTHVLVRFLAHSAAAGRHQFCVRQRPRRRALLLLLLLYLVYVV